jgi:hypothetical protein
MLTPVLCCLIVINALQQSALALPTADDGDVIDLSSLGARLYRNPDYDFGKELSGSDGNPEEKGPYLEGDLLVPRESAKNGMKNDALKWKNGEIPYIIRGRYSECQK